MEIGAIADASRVRKINSVKVSNEIQQIELDSAVHVTSSGYSIAERTCAALTAKYGDVGAEREPISYNGYKLDRNRERVTIKLSLPQKIVEAAREHAPELIDGDIK